MNNNDMANDWVDPDDAPELTDEWFAKADLMLGERVIRKGGRPSQDKVQVTLRLDRAIVERFRAGGKGWQTRLNEALRNAS